MTDQGRKDEAVSKMTEDFSEDPALESSQENALPTVSNLVDQVGSRVEGAMRQLAGDLDVASVFSPPERVGDRVIITAASVQRSGGFGFGGGGANDEEPGGGGGGGGANTEGRPVAVIEITPSGVNVRPVYDFTRIWVTVVTGLVAIWRFSRK